MSNTIGNQFFDRILRGHSRKVGLDAVITSGRANTDTGVFLWPEV
jgi:hypothetical protein